MRAFSPRSLGVESTRAGHACGTDAWATLSALPAVWMCPGASAPPYCAPPQLEKKRFPPRNVEECPGDPRLTTDGWVPEKSGARSAARARALTHRTCPSGVGNLLRPPPLGDRTGNSWEKSKEQLGRAEQEKEETES